jgi:ubiquinone/menaquinone biosynthesis C-methylase UbiE
MSYVGVDMFPGDNVDVVCDIHALPFADAAFDACLSFNTLEHDANAPATLAEMARVTKPGGKIFISAAGPGYPPHNVEECGGYYKNIDESLFGSEFVVSRYDRGGGCFDIRAVRQ